jgi:hypothetical protein
VLLSFFSTLVSVIAPESSENYESIAVPSPHQALLPHFANTGGAGHPPTKTMAPEDERDVESVGSSSNSDDDTGFHETHAGLESKTKTRSMQRMRFMVSISMILTALGFGAAVVAFTRKEEQRDFESA